MNTIQSFSSHLKSHFPASTLRSAASCALALQLAFSPFLAAGPANSKSDKAAAATPADPVLKVMQTELARANSSLAKSDPAPYFLSYTVSDQNLTVFVGSYGSLLTNFSAQRREADVVMRVGSPALDNTHGQSRPT